MTETRRFDQATEPIRRHPAPQVQVPVPRTRGASARPFADWGKRDQIAAFVVLCLLGANIVVGDLLVARFLLGWHG